MIGKTWRLSTHGLLLSTYAWGCSVCNRHSSPCNTNSAYWRTNALLNTCNKDGNQLCNHMDLYQPQLVFQKVEDQMVAADLKDIHVRQSCNNKSFWHPPIPSPTAWATRHTQHCNHKDNLMLLQLVRGLEREQVLALVPGLALEPGLALVQELV